MKKILTKINFNWILGILMLLLTFILGVPFVNSDGYCYFHIARSVRDYGTFTTPVKPEYYDYRGHVIAYYDGKYADVCASGTAIAELPGLMISKLFRTPQQSIYTDYYLAYNGHTLADGLAVLFTAVIFGYLAMVLLFNYFKQQKLPGKWAAFFTIAITISAYLQWYIYIQAGFTHVYEFFAATALVILGARYYQNRSVKYIVLSGLAAGFGFLVRPTFAIVILAALIWLLYLSKHKIKTILYFGLATIPFLVSYFIYNYQSYGTLIASGYNAIRGENFIIDGQHFNFLNVLFSPQRGWFVYSPLFFLAFIGLIWQLWKGKKDERILAGLSLGVILLTALVYGFWPAWWGGGSNGSRFLIVLAPITAPGLIYLWKKAQDLNLWLKRVILGSMLLTFFFSAILGFCYLFTSTGKLRPIDERMGNMTASDLYTPVDLIRNQLNQIKEASSIKNYLNTLVTGWAGMGNTNLILTTGIEDAALRIDERTAGQVSFLIIPPPIQTQTISDNVVFYLEDTQTKSVYLGQLTGAQPNGKYTFKISAGNYVGISPELTIKPVTPAKYPYLGLDYYTGLRLDNYPVKIFFHRAYNLKFTGPPQAMPPLGQLSYTFGTP